MYKLKDWVDETQLTTTLSWNERAVEYLENHEHFIDMDIFQNENAIHIIEKRIQYDEYGYVNNNKNAVNLLRYNPQYINSHRLCRFEHGIEFVDEFIKNNELDRINWIALSINPTAMHILNDPIYYKYIYRLNILNNKNVGEMVKNNLHLIDIIEKNMDKINLYPLSINCNAIHILEKIMDKINNEQLYRNENGLQLIIIIITIKISYLTILIIVKKIIYHLP